MTDDERDIMLLQRKILLSQLSIFYPTAIEGRTLFHGVLGASPEYTKHRCFRDLSYLQEKGYVAQRRPGRRADPREAEWQSTYWALTAAGLEIAQRVERDPALEI